MKRRRMLIPPLEEDTPKVASPRPASGWQRKGEIAPVVVEDCWRRFCSGEAVACPAECGDRVAILVAHAGIYRLCCVRCAWQTEWFAWLGDYLRVLEGFDAVELDRR